MNTTVIAKNRIPLEKILPNPEQPRKVFDEGEMMNLAASIREHDVIQPIAVEQAGEYYILHDGERRVRAAKLAGLVDIPAVVVPPLNGSGPQDRLTRAVVANVQRTDMNPVEEAHAYLRMQDEFGWNVNKISKKTGVYPKRIFDLLPLCKLEPEIQELIATRKFGHDTKLIKAILEIPESQARVNLVIGLAKRKTTNKGCIEAAKRLTEILNSKEAFREHTPSMVMAGRTVTGPYLMPNNNLYDHRVSQTLRLIAAAAEGLLKRTDVHMQEVLNAVERIYKWMWLRPGMPADLIIPTEWWATPIGHMTLMAQLWASGDELVTLSQAAEISGKSASSLSQLLDRRKITAYPDPSEPNPQRRTRVMRSEVEGLK